MAHREEFHQQVGMCVLVSVCLCHGGAFPRELLPERLGRWSFLLAAFGRVSLRVLGQGVVAQKVEGYSAFKMCLVTTSPGSPQPYLIHPLLPSSSGALIQCPWRAEILCLLSPTCQEPEQCLALCKHIVVLAELNNSERNISASKQT